MRVRSVVKMERVKQVYTRKHEDKYNSDFSTETGYFIGILAVLLGTVGLIALFC